MGINEKGFGVVRGFGGGNGTPFEVAGFGWRFLRAGLLGVTVGIVATGCIHVPPQQQRLVSKPNMEFSETLSFNYQHKLLHQVEPGTAFSAGAQASGCTACK